MFTGASELPTAIKLINEPCHFAVEELFFSTTDLKGRIHRANSIFRRISGYSWAELNNKPHNVIRHPDMPRIVFQLLWEFIESGKPIVAYVKNRAHDGRYYWVVALVVPIPAGYLSVRFKPTSPLLQTVKQLYGELRSVEAAVEHETNDKRAAMAASKQVLEKSLHTLNLNDYGDFMQHALKQEMQSREVQLRQLPAPSTAINSRIAGERATELDLLVTAAHMFDELLRVLCELFGDLESYVDINKGVRTKSDNVTNISESLRVLALSGAVESDRLGVKGLGLRPVLDWLRAFSLEITKEGSRLSTSLLELIREVDLVVFGLSAAKLQIEMNARFAHELVDLALAGHLEDGADVSTEGAIACLHASSCNTVRQALTTLGGVKKRLDGLTGSQSKLLESSRSLRPIYLRGKIEMAEGVGPRLESVFREVSDQLNETVSNLGGLKELLDNLEAHLIRGLAHGKRVDESIAQIDLKLNEIAHSHA